METNKGQGRYPLDHPRSGGFFVMWAKQTLLSKKLKNDHILATFIRVLAVAQLTNFQRGRFEKADMPIAPLSIANKAGITVEQLNNLVIMDLIGKEVKNSEVYYFIKSWEEHQNPKNGTYSEPIQEVRKEVRKEPPKKGKHPFISSSDSSVHQSSSNAKYGSKSKKVEV